MVMESSFLSGSKNESAISSIDRYRSYHHQGKMGSILEEKDVAGSVLNNFAYTIIQDLISRIEEAGLATADQLVPVANEMLKDISEEGVKLRKMPAPRKKATEGRPRSKRTSIVDAALRMKPELEWESLEATGFSVCVNVAFPKGKVVRHDDTDKIVGFFDEEFSKLESEDLPSLFGKGFNNIDYSVLVKKQD